MEHGALLNGLPHPCGPIRSKHNQFDFQLSNMGAALALGGYVRQLFLVATLLILAGCGGGSGGDDESGSAAQFSLSANSLTFNAATPASGTPLEVPISATVDGTVDGTLYVIIEVGGQAVASVSDVSITGANSGGALVYPVSPQILGAGTFSSVLTVKACVDSPTCATRQLKGSPQTVKVSYTIGSSVQQDTVVPRVVRANAAGSVVIRGSGFEGVTSVKFDSTSGSATARSATEIAATFPSLRAGTYTVSLNNGSVAFSGALVVVDPIDFQADDLTYPAGQPTDIGGLVYDEEHHALFVVVRYSDSSLNQLLRYEFDGTNWSAPIASTIAQLRDVALLHDGQTLLALDDATVRELDTVSLAPKHSTVNVSNFQLLGGFMRNLVIGNDGNAIVSTDSNGSGFTDVYLYSPKSRTFSDLSHPAAGQLVGNAQRGVAGVSVDGSIAVISPGALEYSASTGILSKSTATFPSSSIGYYPPILDSSGARIVISDGSATQVLTRDYSLNCSLPSNTRAYAVTTDGSRVYTLNALSELTAFDLTSNTGGGLCSSSSSAIPTTDPGINPLNELFPPSYVHMAISRDGQTLFIAGVDGLFVRRVPQ